MAKLKVFGAIIPNSYKWFYDWLDEECTCPADAEKAIAAANGETLDVEINSTGGEISAGSEIYTRLKKYGNLHISIIGEACSAASVIAMAGPSEMAPTALMMVHCVSTKAAGNHSEMEHTAEVLRAADEALCSAYVSKSGMSQDEALDMMERETWLTAEQAVSLGLVDKVMFADVAELMAASLFALPTAEQMAQARLAIQAGANTGAEEKTDQTDESAHTGECSQVLDDAAGAEAETDESGSESPTNAENSDSPVTCQTDETPADGQKSADMANKTKAAMARAKFLNLKGEFKSDAE